MTDIIVGRFFGSDTVAEKLEDGSWKVTVNMTEKMKLKGGEWEEKILSTFCTDDEFDKAYMVAANATLEKFQQVLNDNKSNSMFGNIGQGKEVKKDE